MTRHLPLLLLVAALLGSATLGLSQTTASDKGTEQPKPVRVLNAHLGELPGLINADKTGPFVDSGVRHR